MARAEDPTPPETPAPPAADATVPGDAANPAPDPEHPHGAAFFDLDKTLVAGASGFYWARAAAATGMISKRRLAYEGWANVKYRLKGSTDASTQAVWERAGALLADRRVRDFERLSPRVLAGLLPRLYPEMLEIAWEHQDAGRRVYIVTASTQETADMVAGVLFFDGAIGSRVEIVDGHYTGRPAGPMAYREGKAIAIRELAEREGIDLAASWAYSDSESDLPMLRTVGYPVAVNPDSELSRIAADEGWDVLRLERLGSRLKALAALAALASLGGLGRSVQVRGHLRRPGGLLGTPTIGEKVASGAAKAATTAKPKPKPRRLR